MYSLTLKDFSGGLCTSINEAELPANMTADLLNVDFLDSKAITRRNGYKLFSTIESRPVYSIYKYYKTDASKYWMAVCGSALYKMTDVSTIVPLTKIQAEDIAITGTFNTFSDTSYSAGFGVSLAASVNTFTVPACTDITVGFGVTGDAKIAIDAGAYTALSQVAQKAFNGLANTTHTIKIIGVVDETPIDATNFSSTVGNYGASGSFTLSRYTIVDNIPIYYDNSDNTSAISSVTVTVTLSGVTKISVTSTEGVAAHATKWINVAVPRIGLEAGTYTITAVGVI
jgi:hypothetical protein